MFTLPGIHWFPLFSLILTWPLSFIYSFLASTRNKFHKLNWTRGIQCHSNLRSCLCCMEFSVLLWVLALRSKFLVVMGDSRGQRVTVSSRPKLRFIFAPISLSLSAKHAVAWCFLQVLGVITGATSLLCTQTDEERSHMSSVKHHKRGKTDCKRKGKLGGRFRKFAVSPAFACVGVFTQAYRVHSVCQNIFTMTKKLGKSPWQPYLCLDIVA